MSSVKFVKVQDSSFDNLSSIKISLNDFIEIINSSESEIVFKGVVRYRTDDSYFFIRNGVILYTDFIDVHTWSEFKGEHQKMKDGGFTKYEDFSDAFQFGIDTNEIYEEFTKSEVYYDNDGRYSDPDQKKAIYDKYIVFNNSGFKELSEYNEALKLGIEDLTDYYLFKSSEWYDRRYNSSSTQRDYLAFKSAMKKGFSSKDDYERATEMGFLEAAVYGMFVESGLETKEEFDYMLNVFPSIVENELVSINQIKTEADVAYEENRYQESVQKGYLYVEKLLNLAYTAMYKRKIEKEVMYDEVLKDLISKRNLQIERIDEFTNCRRMRNAITHDNYKVSNQEASNAKKYLEKLGATLIQFLKMAVQT